VYRPAGALGDYAICRGCDFEYIGKAYKDLLEKAQQRELAKQQAQRTS
jgi:hypothetical protein